MPTITRLEGETLAELAVRVYATRGPGGAIDRACVERVEAALIAANPDLQPGDRVELPYVDGIPCTYRLIDEPAQLHDIVHPLLEEIHNDRRLLILSFIDPIRLGREEFGIEATPDLVQDVRTRLAGAISFDQEAYQQALDGHDPFEGRPLAWRADGD